MTREAERRTKEQIFTVTINWLYFTDCFKVLRVVTVIMNKVVKPKLLKELLARLLLLYVITAS